MTVDEAKELLGWVEESENVKFGSDYLFKDQYGKKIRCLNNTSNRPFYPSIAEAYALEILRLKWRMNGESLIIDEFGLTQDCQHRLVGLVWADQMRSQDLPTWSTYWKSPCTMETFLVVGIKGDDETINTINTGKPRTFSDVMYRSGFFEKVRSKDRAKLANMASNAVKLVWFRTAADLVSYAPRRPHSESLEFIDNHPRLLDCVRHIFEEEGDKERRISCLVPLGQASGLMYLMAASASSSGKYEDCPTEESVDFSRYEKAEEFWTYFAQESETLKPLRDKLGRLDSGGTFARDCTIGLVLKAWSMYASKSKIDPSQLSLSTSKDEWGRPYLTENPRAGGIDMGEKVT